MKLEWKEQLKIPDGLHEGVIIGVQNRTEPYNYTDLIIEFTAPGELENVATLKAGYATKLTENTKLGRMLTRFGAIPKVGMTVDLEKCLIGKKCQFQTVMVMNKEKREFANIMPDTVKPV